MPPETRARPGARVLAEAENPGLMPSPLLRLLSRPLWESKATGVGAGAGAEWPLPVVHWPADAHPKVLSILNF